MDQILENAVAAIRVSSVKQGVDGDSPEAQKEQIERYAATHNIHIKKFLIFLESASKDEQPVQEAIDKNNKECTEGKPAFMQGFLTTRDINADGKPDYVLNYEHYRCGEIETLFCGTGGCQTEVFASDGDGGLVHVWDKLAQRIRFRTIHKRPAMVIDLHGSLCGRNNSERCRMTLYWNGSEFHPAN